MFVAGQGVNGGAYYVTEWKPLTDDLEADLHVTTDYRQVLAEIVAARFPAAPRSTVFPGLAPVSAARLHGGYLNGGHLRGEVGGDAAP
jgi:hypothetical protein